MQRRERPKGGRDHAYGGDCGGGVRGVRGEAGFGSGIGFAPVGMGLPPRRDGGGSGGVAPAAVRAGGFVGPGDVPVRATGLRVVREGEDDGSIIVPMARDRLLEIFERVQRPGEVASTLEGALTGQLWQQQLLFQAMVDSWPRLQKALREVKLAARKAPWRVEAYARRGEKPKARAEKLAREVEEMVWGMKPDPVRGLKGFEGTVEELAMGYFMGHHVLEPHWRRNADGMLAPVSTLPVPPRYYGYPSLEDGPDRLMLDRNGAMLGVGSSALEDFPKHRFLVAVNGGHPGHPAQAAPLRVLTGYWLAAVYGLKWFMQFAQLFGIPFRWATYPEGDGKAKAELAAMMGNLGSQGWAAFKQGVEMNFLESGKGGGNLAQAELLRLADEQCDVFVLGQTLTSSQGERGSQALGTVHMEVRREVVEGVCDFVGEILTHQLIPAMVAANYGESRTDVPGMWARWPEPRDERGMAERDRALGLLDGKMPVEREWMYERHGVPVPGEGAVLFVEVPAGEDEESGEEDPDEDDELTGDEADEEAVEDDELTADGGGDADGDAGEEEAGEDGELTTDDADATDGDAGDDDEVAEEAGEDDDEAVASRLAGAGDTRTWRGRSGGALQARVPGRPSGAEPRAPRGGEVGNTRSVVEAAFNPNQLRQPKGAAGGKGGEFAKGGGSSAGGDAGRAGRGNGAGKAGKSGQEGKAGERGGPGKSGAGGKSGKRIYVQSDRGKGGAHRHVKGVKGNEAHHIPPSALIRLMGIPYGKGPAMSMSAADHRKTESWGNSDKSKRHHAKVKALLEKGQFRKALELDINNVRKLFPGRYERQIREMRQYIKDLYRDPEMKKVLERKRRL